MPSNANRQFLDFEKPIKDLIDEIEKLKHASEHKKIDYSEMIRQLEQQILDRRKEITQNPSPSYQYTLKYKVCPGGGLIAPSARHSDFA